MSRVIAAFAQFFDGSGDPLEDGWLAFLESGTTSTDKNTYADADLNIPNANPLQLDGEGRCPNVFGFGIYKVRLYTNNPVTKLPGELIQEFDPVIAEYTIADSGDNFAEWNVNTIYQIGSIVYYNGDYYSSNTANNLANIPTASSAYWEKFGFLRYWNTNVTYSLDDVVVDSGAMYFSLQNSNTGHVPLTSPTWWNPVGSGTTLLNWEENGTDFRPKIDGYNIGDATHEVGTLYAKDLDVSGYLTNPLMFADSVHLLLGNSGDLDIYHTGTDGMIVNDTGDVSVINTDVAGEVIFGTNSVERWAVNASGHLVPKTADVYNIGSTTLLINDIFLGDSGAVLFGADQDANIAFDNALGDLFITNSTRGIYLYGSDATSFIHFVAGNVSRWEITSAGDFIPQTNNAHDIGSTTNVLNAGYFSNSGVYIGDSQDMRLYSTGSVGYFTQSANYPMQIGNNSDNYLGLRANSAVRWFIAGSSGNYAFYPNTANSVNIGTTSNEVNTIYIGSGGLYIGTTQHCWIWNDGSATEFQSIGDPLRLVCTTGNDMTFQTNSTERMRIDDSALSFLFASNMKIDNLYAYNNAGTGRNVIVDSGGLFKQDTTSLREFKKDITPLDDTSWLYDLEPISYVFNGPTNEGTEYGIIAEDLELVNRDMCYYDYEWEEKDDKGRRKKKNNSTETLAGVKYKSLNIAMLREIQRLNERIKVLEGA